MGLWCVLVVAIAGGYGKHSPSHAPQSGTESGSGLSLLPCIESNHDSGWE